MRRTAILLLSIGAVFVTGCESFVVRQMVIAPNHDKSASHFKPTEQWVLDLHHIDGEGFIDVGPPEATLHYYLLEPDDPLTLIDGRPRGTVIVLHGKGADSWLLLVKGKDLVKAGYRVVMVDMRGHGKSTGDYLSYGAMESADLVQVVDHLQSENLVAGKLGVWGISMGGAIAIQLAGRDSRIEAVVSVIPYSNMRQVVANMVHNVFPLWNIDDKKMQAMVDKAAENAGFDPDQADCITSIQKTQAPVLIFGGKMDAICPIEQARAIHAAAPKHSKLIEVDLAGHVVVGVDAMGEVRRESIRWFDHYLAGVAPTDQTAMRHE